MERRLPPIRLREDLHLMVKKIAESSNRTLSETCEWFILQGMRLGPPIPVVPPPFKDPLQELRYDSGLEAKSGPRKRPKR